MRKLMIKCDICNKELDKEDAYKLTAGTATRAVRAEICGEMPEKLENLRTQLEGIDFCENCFKKIVVQLLQITEKTDEGLYQVYQDCKKRLQMKVNILDTNNERKIILVDVKKFVNLDGTFDKKKMISEFGLEGPVQYNRVKEAINAHMAEHRDLWAS